MKIAYFDCFAGISGDMILGALVDVGLEWEQLLADLAKLPLTGYQITKEIVTKNGIKGSKVRITAAEEEKHRHLRDIQAIIRESTLPTPVKEQVLVIFRKLAEAEAKVHQTTVHAVHFHEVGAIDAILDIVGAVSGLWRLGIKEVYALFLPGGGGLCSCEQGLLPVPAPATMELLKGVPIYTNEIKKEIVTPTGAAILTAFCRHYGQMPLMRVHNIGYGAGSLDLAIPNLLRLCIGEKVEQALPQGEALMLEANIDDMNPEFYDHVMNKMLKAGAMDVFLRQIQMKKNRPGVILCALIHHHQAEQFYRLIFSETTSIGVRAYPVSKFMLPYEIVTVATRFGPIRVKVAGDLEQVRNIAPEYEDCSNLAEINQVPLKEVYDEAKYLAYKTLNPEG